MQSLKRIIFMLTSKPTYLKEIPNTLKLLRFPFSVFLLPVSLFSFFYIQPAGNYQLLLVIAIWHVLVFPASNGYNSFNDADEGPIGGLASPPKPTKFLLNTVNVMDSLAIVLSFLVNFYFVFFCFCFTFLHHVCTVIKPFA